MSGKKKISRGTKITGVTGGHENRVGEQWDNIVQLRPAGGTITIQIEDKVRGQGLRMLARERSTREYAAAVRKMRRRAKLSQAELAARTNRKKAYVCDIENNRVRKNAQGEWIHMKAPLEYLYEVAAVTGSRFKLDIEE